MKFGIGGCVIAALLFVSAGFGIGQQPQTSTTLEDPVARLARRIERGEVKLEFEADGWGYLRSLLKHLDLYIDSQVLVFSKTSFQLNQISPQTPRALYFNDNVALGAVQNGNVFELTSLDPTQGIIYYTVNAQKDEKPRFERRFNECLNCHGPAKGLVVSSVFPAKDGTPFVTGTFFEGVDHRTPFEKRWGGWYVSGTHGAMRHMGNAVAPDPDRPFDLQEAGTQNLTSLTGKFDTSKYVTPTSDIVALMTLEHQTHMTNLILRVGQQFRQASRSAANENSGARLDEAVEAVVSYMLFADEAPLSAPVKGVSTFTETFAKRGPHDKKGRSLRDFDLEKRLFRYPLSYMIYSEIFDELPLGARLRISQRLYAVLTGNDSSEKFARLSAADRRAILEILQDTKPDWPPTAVGD
jgi:hypothetical protein